jgi:hypothetical protein
MSSSLGYSTLHEAWGESSGPKRRKSKVPVAVSPAPDREYLPASQEREYRALSGLDDQQAWAEYNKEDTQRSDAPLPGLIGPERRYPASVDVVADAGVAVPDERQYETGYVAPHGDVPDKKPVRLDVADRAMVHQTPEPKHDDNAAYDVALYVFSGIALILLLEQFVQMGIAMRVTS